MRVNIKAIGISIVTVALGLVFAVPSEARRGKRYRIPSKVVNAVKARAGIDMGAQGKKVRVYTSGWSRSQSFGLKSQLGGRKAWVVHAKSRGDVKKRGPYLVAESNQGLEVFPLGLKANKQGKPVKNRHITKIKYDNPAPANTYAFADGRLGGTKVVQGVKATKTHHVSDIWGASQIVAKKEKPRKREATYFVLGDPIRQNRGPGIAAQSGSGTRDLVAPPPGTGHRPPPGPLPKMVNTKFVELNNNNSVTASAQTLLWSGPMIYYRQNSNR